MTVKAAPKKLPELTHEGLIAAGYVREDFNASGLYPGWVTYRLGGSDHSLFATWQHKIGFAGNNATMNNWIENVSRWQTNWPDLYAWWTDPKRTEPFEASATRETIIKGEDPLIKPE